MWKEHNFIWEKESPSSYIKVKLLSRKTVMYLLFIFVHILHTFKKNYYILLLFSKETVTSHQVIIKHTVPFLSELLALSSLYF